MPITIQGRIEDIRFQNEDTAWTVATLMPKDKKPVSLVGILPGIHIGQDIEATGDYETTKYGTQFKASDYHETEPSDTEGIYNYLASGLIKNIGPVFARCIVDTFGEETLDVLDNSPERLREVKGIGPKRIASVIASVKEQKAVRSIMIWLKRYGLTNSLASKIYKSYGNDSVALLEENPYRLADDIKGVGFLKADTVARQLGLPSDSPFRILSGLHYCLETAASEGNTYMDVEELIRKTASDDYLSIGEETVRSTVESALVSQVAVIEDSRAFLPQYYHAERAIASRLMKILEEGVRDPEGRIDFNRLSLDSGLSYSAEQLRAIRLALQESILILTGGPGTGKTTTTNAIIHECRSRQWRIVLAAPTGRAAKRMEEATGMPSKTIHRLLEYSGGAFTRNETHPIDADVIIIDEASMIDTVLMKQFLKAVSDKTKLIIVGDEDQLPSVGAGSVLRDLIRSAAFPTVRLTEIYRQAQDSDIVMNAHAINEGRMPSLHPAVEHDFVFRDIQDREVIAQRIESYVKSLLARRTYAPEDIQILTPMRRDGDPIGATMLNRRLQAALNPGGEPVAKKRDTELRVGDRIMQLKNDYDKDIYNGDIGKITACLDGKDDDKAVMEASFDCGTVRFCKEDLTEVDLAYATTVHKAQGSEYPLVIMPVHESQYKLLVRNLVYTGITRAKKGCIILGTEKAMRIALSKPETKRRNTFLTERIMNYTKEERNTLF